MSERDYVLGTNDEEVERLGLQHRVWRPHMLDAFRRAGIGRGASVIDVGAGPGFAATDLAEIAGPSGKILALERSRRFLDVLEDRARRLGLGNIEAREQDVAEAGFGEGFAEASWCRWLLSFVGDPRRTVGHIARALKPGGRAVFHEYADYGAWRTLPPDPEVERFRDLAMRSWRESGGEPDVALRLPGWLEAAGLEIVGMRPLVHAVRKGDFIWEWPASFMASGAKRLAELGYVEVEEAERLATALDRAAEGSWMITPLVLEVIARK
ncbi:MAG TPA: methyltransferase domain-containing protein [Allosphingosinicella sp.]|nr:methyltransferase domain-containing protein [Allosphingosinicella sp.]